jgi:ferritin-like metal-binding protein YciE
MPPDLAREVSATQNFNAGEAANVLQQTLDEEQAADAKLTQLGEIAINPSAAQERRAA